MHSFSQLGEDRIAWYFLEKYGPGVYVDIGAHHPKELNNTYLFYENGWRGVLVEPLAERALELCSARPGDIVLDRACAMQKEIVLTRFNHDVLTTGKLESYYVDCGFQSISRFRVMASPLSEILEIAETQIYTHRKPVRFLSVDCEGMDLEVLQSHDWKTIRPLIVCVETKECGTDRQFPEITRFMLDQGYEVLANTWLNTLFCTRELKK